MNDGKRKGGLARAKVLSPERRSEIARKAARSRWSRSKEKDMCFTNKKIQSMDRLLAKRLEEVGKVRDRIDETIAELKDLRENCREAREALQDARDALSRLV